MNKILIILGSASDLTYGEKIASKLDEFSIPYKLVVSSAHRTPDGTVQLVKDCPKEGIKLIIAVAGMAAHLPGVCAANTTLPVIAVPVATGPLNGVDALYASVMMPSGIPVATVTVGEAGASNAAILAASIFSITDKNLQDKLAKMRDGMREKTHLKNQEIQKKFSS